MMNDKDWNDLMLGHELAYLRGDLATSSPESYTIQEMKEISDDMFASTAEVEAAIRKDFQELPLHAQARMLHLLQEADPDNYQWWVGVLTAQTAGRSGPNIARRPINRLGGWGAGLKYLPSHACDLFLTFS